MPLEENLRQLDTHISDGDFSISIKFNRLERRFDDKNRMLVLYSDVRYKTESFAWESTLPVVNIPYRDPALGFFIDGVIFSSVGVYSRAPGIVPDVDKRVLKERIVEEPKVEIITARNSTISIGYKRNAVHIIFKRGGSEHKVPIGIFLKAFSGLPYSEILKNFAYKPQMLLNAFPCSIPKGGEDLSKYDTYGLDSKEEPSIDECVNCVYNAITPVRGPSSAKYTTHWKVNRITGFLNNMHFKTRQKYESTLAIGNRAVGAYLDENLDIPYFKKIVDVQERLDRSGKKVEQRSVREVVDHFKLPKGHYITDADAREIRRFDIEKLRVKTTRSFVLQEKSPMLFRAKGYKLVKDLAEVGAHAGDIIDDELLSKINSTQLLYLEVYTPNGRKVLHRSGEPAELGDFYTVLNYLFTHVYLQKSDTSQYEVSNRVIFDYTKQVRMEVEQTYSDIIGAVTGSTELKNLLSALPNLPSNRLAQYLRSSKHKEISQSDITNIMSRAISDTKASALMRETPAEMMPVQRGQYGRLDSFHAPDSDKVGSVQQLTCLARIDGETSEIEAPYERVVNGVPTGEIVYLTAAKENKKYIAAWNEEFKDAVVMARYNGDITTVDRDKVEYRDPSPFCDMSVSRMCIPFPGFSQPKRALMATKMNGQAIPLLFPERPLVSTGADTEVPCLYYTGRNVVESNNLECIEGEILELVGHEWKKNIVDYRFVYTGKVLNFSVPFTATDKESLYNYNLNIHPDKRYGLDDIIFYHQCCDMREYDYWTRIDQGTLPLFKDHTKPAMALGVNLRVCFKTYGSSTVDDACLISDRLITDNTLTSIQIMKYDYELRANEEFAETDWGAPLHSHVYKGQPLIVASRSKGAKGRTERHVDCKQEGEVVYANKDMQKKKAEIWVSTFHSAAVGDKIAGRFGDKSVIAKIVPEDMMPYDPETGETMDVVLSPLGMPSRMNYGRILEVALGGVMKAQGLHAVVTPFYPDIKKEVIDAYENAGLKPKKLFNPIFGKMTERPVMVGYLYIIKLEQMSNLKTKAVGYPTAVDPVFGQPVDSLNQNKGQAIGEMESWALGAAGAHGILNSLHTIYSGDEAARSDYFNAMESTLNSLDSPWDESPLESSKHSTNKNALVTQTVVRMFGNDIDVEDNKFHIFPLNMDDIHIQVSQEEFVNGREITEESEWFAVPLSAPVINPFWVENFPLNIVLGVKSVKTLVAGTAFLDLNQLNNRQNCIIPASEVQDHTKMHLITGINAVIELVKNTTVDEAIERLRYKPLSEQRTQIVSDDSTVDVEFTGELDFDDTYDLSILGDISEVPMNVADVLRFLWQMKKKGRELNSLIWYLMPIMPRVFRQSNTRKDRTQEHSFQTQLKAICSSRATSASIYTALKDLIGYGTSKHEDLTSIRGYFFGKNSQAGNHGKVRGAVLSKRVGFSGRVVIVPMADPTISPFFVGLPWHTVVIELGKVLGMRLKKMSALIEVEITRNTSISRTIVSKLSCSEWQKVVESLGSFNPYILRQYFKSEEDTGPRVRPVHSKSSDADDELYFVFCLLRRIVRGIVEGDVTSDGLVNVDGEYVDPATVPKGTTLNCAIVIVGRQPTLHKKSLRSYFVKIVDGYCMHMHPMVCASYNADFDGDQMWDLQLFGDDKIEACNTISILQDLVSEKDGSFTLSIVQDTALGLYCATSFKNNSGTFEGKAGEYYFFDDLEELYTQLEYGDLHFYDAVMYHHKDTNSYYLSTAGRILVNGTVPGCLTQKPFTDPNGICAKVLNAGRVSTFKELLYDCVWTTTDIHAAGRDRYVKIADILLDVYTVQGARKSVMVAQAVYEIGIMASDVYSVTMSLDDMSSTVDKSKYMEEPRNIVARLNSLYQLGLVTDDSRKMASVHAWDTAKKDAQSEILQSLDPNSNTYYMMYSGARGKPDQVMQSVGFIGNIAKTKDQDIEYPILRGYGEGLSSFDLAQTAPSARIGVISTQSGTKETGYAGRQSVYMTSGLEVAEEDCGISMSVIPVEYDMNNIVIRGDDGDKFPLDSLLGDFVDSSTEGFELLRDALNLSGYMINRQVLDIIVSSSIHSVTLLDKKVDIVYAVSNEWRTDAVSNMYSYALPYTDNMKITQETVNWIERMGLKEIVAFDKRAYDTQTYFDREAYLPVDYDTSKYSITMGGKKISDEELYTFTVSGDSPGFYYYKNLLLEDGHLTEKALRYLTKKRIPSVKFTDGNTVNIRYQLSALFKSVISGRVSRGLLYLDSSSCITQDTMQAIEDLQLQFIPVRSSLTCLTRHGICAKCYGKSLSTNKFHKVKDNLGIGASQAMTEPLSQATLDVAHSGGKRSAGTAMVSGLDYYKHMLRGTMVTQRTASLLEKFSPWSGYVTQNKHNKSFIQILDDTGKIHTMELDDPDRLNVPSGAYIDQNDTIISGLPDFERYNSTDVFDSALRTRYQLIQEYNKIFAALKVSSRNSEVMARAQTSMCYAVGKGATSKIKDTAEEASNPTGDYMLRVSSQAQVVIYFSSIAGYGFENVANMLLMQLFTVDGLPQNSILANLITGTEVGSTEAKFIKKFGDGKASVHHKSNVRSRIESLGAEEKNMGFSLTLGLTEDENRPAYSLSAEEEILNKLLEEPSEEFDALPGFEDEQEQTTKSIPEIAPMEFIQAEPESEAMEQVEEIQDREEFPFDLVIEEVSDSDEDVPSTEKGKKVPKNAEDYKSNLSDLGRMSFFDK